MRILPEDLFIRHCMNHSNLKNPTEWECTANDIKTVRTPPLVPSGKHQHKYLCNLQSGKKSKLCGPPRSSHEDPMAIHGKELVQSLLSQKIILAPIGVDPFNHLGPISMRQLFDSHRTVPDYPRNTWTSKKE
jgi:hypothetical protein